MSEAYHQIKNKKLNPKCSYYVYIHTRKLDNKIFYVGKGSGRRAWEFRGRNNWWNKVHKKYGINVELVFENLTEEEAFQCEKDTILEFTYFGYSLVNLNEGGSGGSSPSLETRVKMAKAKLNMYTGNKNPFADKNNYTFIRINDNLEITCTRSDLISTFNLKRSEIKKLFYKTKPRKTAIGWKLKGTI